MVHVFLLSVNNDGHFTWKTKYLFACISASLVGIILKSHYTRMLGCDCSLMKLILLKYPVLFHLYLGF